MVAMTQSRCEQCDVVFTTRLAEVKRGKGRFCSAKCANTARSRARLAPMAFKRTPEYRRNNSYSIAQRAAHHQVEYALANGSLLREPCEVCGAEKVDAHHDDYSKPLSVRWLCRKHHLEHHRKHSNP